MKPVPSVQPSFGKELLKRAVALSLLLGSIMLLALGLRSEANGPAVRDFIAYWSAGHLLLHRLSPYDARAILELERSAGYSPSTALITRNPPWALPITLPLGFLSPYWGALVWIIGIVACVMVAVRLCRAAHGNPPDRIHLGIYLFAPTIACIITGQAAALTCLGVAVFLRYRAERPFVAGLGCALMMFKPHLFLLIWLVLIIDSARRRKFAILGGLLVGIGAGSLCALCFDPRVFTDYIDMTRTAGIESEFIPAPATIFRVVVNKNAWVLQFVPALIGLVWSIVYYLRKRTGWEWERGTPLLLLVSVFISPYAWLSDEIALAPVIIHAVYLIRNEPGGLSQNRVRVLFGLNTLACLLVFAGIPMASGAYVWTSGAWLLWYLFAMKKRERLPLMATREA